MKVYSLALLMQGVYIIEKLCPGFAFLSTKAFDNALITFSAMTYQRQSQDYERQRIRELLRYVDIDRNSNQYRNGMLTIFG